MITDGGFSALQLRYTQSKHRAFISRIQEVSIRVSGAAKWSMQLINCSSVFDRGFKHLVCSLIATD